MAINTTITKKSPTLQAISDPSDRISAAPKDANQVTELEISLPMLLVILVALAVVIYGAFYFFGGKKNGTNTVKTQPETITESLADVSNISLEGAEFFGNEKAKYVFLVLSDFECPACQYYEMGTGEAGNVSIAAQIKKQYIDSGVVRGAFLPYILVPSHKPAATNETLAYFCAVDQGKGDVFRHQIFSKTFTNGLGINGKGSEKNDLISAAKTVGLDEKLFTDCYDKRDLNRINIIDERLDKEVKNPWIEQKGDYFGTPSFAICKVNQENSLSCSGKVFVGAYPFNDMKNALDSFLGADAPK
jgi:protein-disulfide isomerase